MCGTYIYSSCGFITSIPVLSCEKLDLSRSEVKALALLLFTLLEEDYLNGPDIYFFNIIMYCNIAGLDFDSFRKLTSGPKLWRDYPIMYAYLP